MTMFRKFYICPGVSGDSPEEEKLLREHESEANDRGAEFYNYGWSSGEHWICSKTAHGFLGSRINPKTMRVTHSWVSFAEHERMQPLIFRKGPLSDFLQRLIGRRWYLYLACRYYLRLAQKNVTNEEGSQPCG